jgi:hypothetical protein
LQLQRFRISFSMMVTVSVKTIPQYLRNGALANVIEDDDGETFDVPDSCYKSDLMIKSSTDLSLLLSTLRYWGVDTMPREVILYVVWKKPQEVLHSTGDFERELRYLQFLQHLSTKTALSCGERSSDYWGYNSSIAWSSDPSDAAALICLIHYDNANGNIWTADTTALAARLGQLHALQFLHENGCPWAESSCSSAASRGHLSCLQYAHEQGCAWNAKTCTEAAQNGHLLCLKYACEQGCPIDVETLRLAVRHTPSYMFLCDVGLLVLDAGLCATAARTSNLAVLRQLHERGCPWDSSTSEGAAQAGSLECLQYAHEEGCPWISKTCGDAAQHGSLDCLRYAIEHGCTTATDLIVDAAPYLPCLRYLHEEQGIPWHKETCERAAFVGKADSLRYAHEHGCPWDARTCEAAARRGHLAVLCYAHEQGCPWDARTTNAAAGEGKDSCLEYALARNCPTDHTICFRAAASSLGCLMLAREHGCTWDTKACAAAAKAGKIECLQYLFEQDCPWDAATTYAAVEAGKLDCLQYAHARGCPWVVAQLLAIPLTVKSRRCLEYVREQAPTEAAVYDASILAQQEKIQQYDPLFSFLGDPCSLKLATDALLEEFTSGCFSFTTQVSVPGIGLAAESLTDITCTFTGGKAACYSYTARSHTGPTVVTSVRYNPETGSTTLQSRISTTGTRSSHSFLYVNTEDLQVGKIALRGVTDKAK